MQAGPGELGDAVAQASEHVVERQQGAPAELDDHGFLDRGRDGAVRARGPMGASSVVVRARHLDIMLRLSPWRLAKAPLVSSDA